MDKCVAHTRITNEGKVSISRDSLYVEKFYCHMFRLMYEE